MNNNTPKCFVHKGCTEETLEKKLSLQIVNYQFTFKNLDNELLPNWGKH